jgi:hypothetical protein
MLWRTLMLFPTLKLVHCRKIQIDAFVARDAEHAVGLDGATIRVPGENIYALPFSFFQQPLQRSETTYFSPKPHARDFIFTRSGEEVDDVSPRRFLRYSQNNAPVCELLSEYPGQRLWRWGRTYICMRHRLSLLPRYFRWRLRGTNQRSSALYVVQDG